MGNRRTDLKFQPLRQILANMIDSAKPGKVGRKKIDDIYLIVSAKIFLLQKGLLSPFRQAQDRSLIYH